MQNLSHREVPPTMTSTTTLSPSAAHWTYADYLSLSDDERFEIYAGVLTPVPAPDLAHQRLHCVDLVRVAEKPNALARAALRTRKLSE